MTQPFMPMSAGLIYYNTGYQYLALLLDVHMKVSNKDFKIEASTAILLINSVNCPQQLSAQ
jgi:hypothetical protein